MNAEIKKRCFVISPIGDPNTDIRRHADMVLNSIIKPALPDFDVRRGDELAGPDMINDKIMDAIFNYEIAIADLSGLNPNVFYELGLRHMDQKPVIHIAQLGTRLPFDNAGMTTTFFEVNDWHSHEKARAAISTAVSHALEEGYKPSNPVTSARGSINLTKSADPKDMMIADLMQRVQQLEARTLISKKMKAEPEIHYRDLLSADHNAAADWAVFVHRALKAEIEETKPE